MQTNWKRSKHLISLVLVLAMVLGLMPTALAGGTTPPENGSSLVNLALSQYGTKIEATYANNGDPVDALNDGIISAREGTNGNGEQLDAGPRSRWSSWNQTGTEQTITLTFDGAQEVHSIDWYATYDGGGVKKPQTIKVQALNGATWTDCATASADDGMKFENEFTTGCAGSTEIYHYTMNLSSPVTTTQLRLVLTPESNACVGASELQVWGKPLMNLALSRYGTKIAATYANTGDPVDTLNDGIISAREGTNGNGETLDAGPRSRWSSWNQTGAEQTITLTFDGAQEIRRVDWYATYDGGGVKKPQTIKVQALSGETWTDCATASANDGVKFDNDYTTGCAGSTEIYHYTMNLSSPVTTTQLRLVLTPESDACVGASELQVYGTPVEENPLVNLALGQYGTKIEATHTNPSDRLEDLNDDIISAREGTNGNNEKLDEGPRNRWSSWDQTGVEQTITLTFDGAQEIHRVDWYATYDGGGVKKPKMIKVQALGGEDWIDCAEASANDGVEFNNEYTTDCYGTSLIYHYTMNLSSPVRTTQLRLVLTPESGACVGATELQVWGEYIIPGGFTMLLDKEQNEKLPITLWVTKQDSQQTVYLKLTDTKNVTITENVVFAAGETEKSLEISVANLESSEVTVTGSLSEDFSNPKTLTFIKAIPDSVIEQLYEEVKTPYQYDVIISEGAEGEWDGVSIDNPTMFSMPGDDEYVYMTYSGFDGKGYRNGMARSRDMLTWEKMGIIVERGEPGDWDGATVGGYIVRDHTWGELPTPHVMKDGEYKGQYVLTYFATDKEGYEQGTRQSGAAFTPKIFNEDGSVVKWTRYKEPILSAKDGKYAYEKGIIWKLHVIYNEEDGKYYGYYNTADAPEITCGVTSDDILHWTRMDTNPLIVPENGWGNTHNADPDVVKIGDYWVMFYFTSKPGQSGVIDSFAVSKDMTHWQKSFKSLTELNDSWCCWHAHKPCVVKHNGVVYHYYCAVTWYPEYARTIAVNTSIDLRILKQAQSYDTTQLTAAQKKILDDAIESLQYELRKENGSLEEVTAARDALQNVYNNLTNHTTHTLTKTNAVAATCAADGVKEYWTCDFCGKNFSDAEGTTEIADLDAWKIGEGKISKIDHTWSAEWSKDETSHWHECSVCHAKKGEATHTPGPAATENDPQTCTECGYIIAPATGHIHHTTTLVPAVEATCVSKGHRAYYTCSGCNKLFANENATEELTEADVTPKTDPTNHVGGTEVRNAKDATYTEEGYTGDTCCKSCHAVISYGHVIPKLTKPSKPSGGTVKPVSPNAGVNKKPEAEKKELPFIDVPQTAWYHESVQKAWEIGLIDGVTKTQFQPDGTLTVAQAIKLAAALYQMEHEGEVTLKNGSVTWYDSYVSYAVANGIIEKDYASYTAAQMNAAITRAEFVHIFHGAESTYKAINQVADDAIPDVKTGNAFASDIYEFYRAGILTGSDAKGTFHPASSIKRSEVSAILVRMFDTASRQSIALQ